MMAAVTMTLASSRATDRPRSGRMCNRERFLMADIRAVCYPVRNPTILAHNGGLRMSFTLLALTFALADTPKVEVGKPAPDVTLEAATPTGTKKISLKELKGKNVVLF